MLSIRFRFLFIHVPKTGGNSIQNFLKEWSEDSIITPEQHQDGVERFEVENPEFNLSKHATLTQYKRKLSRDHFARLYKFSVIRNPFDRLISYYFSPHRGVTHWNRDDFASLVKQTPRLRQYVSVPSIFGRTPLDHHLDKLMKFENLQSDFDSVCEDLNLPSHQLAKRNVSSRNHYSVYYDEQLQQMVMKRFAEEIEYGSYTLEPTTGRAAVD